MTYIVLYDDAFSKLAAHVAGNGARVYRHYEDIEAAGADAPFTSVREFGAELKVRFEHPDSTLDRETRFPFTAEADLPALAAAIVAFAQTHGRS
jgi:hypothetical protein